MRTLSTLTLILILISGHLFSQSVSPKPDQLTLMKQFAGNWSNSDSSIKVSLTLQGKGGEGYCDFLFNNKNTFHIKQLWLYNATEDNITIVQLSGSERLECWKIKFTTPTKGEGKFFNLEDPSRILEEWTIEFVTPDKMVETKASDPNKYTQTLYRVK